MFKKCKYRLIKYYIKRIKIFTFHFDCIGESSFCNSNDLEEGQTHAILLAQLWDLVAPRVGFFAKE